MAIPDFQSIMLPVLRLLVKQRWATADLITSVADEHGMSAEERAALLPSGRQRVFANRIHWALAYLNRAGLVVRVAKGQYEASPIGQELLTNPPTSISIAFLQQLPAYALSRTDAGRDGPSTDKVDTVVATEKAVAGSQSGTPEERLDAADRDLRAEVAAALLGQLHALSPEAFERLIIDVLVGMGYGGTRRDAAKHLGRSGDGGIDGVIREDALGLDMIYLQAKRHASDNPVGAPAIQGFAGALLSCGASKGVFVTTSRFTSQARQTAAGYKAHRIVLIDGFELTRLMLEHEVGVKTVQVIRVQRAALDAYEEEIG